MPATVVFTAKARTSLIRIAVYVALDNEAAGYRLVTEIEKRVIETLSVFPDAGSRVETGKRQLTSDAIRLFIAMMLRKGKF